MLVDSFVDKKADGAAIGVVSGTMGIFDFLKNRYLELTASNPTEVKNKLEKDFSKWKKEMSSDIDNIQSEINLLPERQSFFDSMEEIKKEFKNIYINFHSVLNQDCPTSKDDRRLGSTSKSEASDCRIIAEKIIGNYKTSDNPLLRIHHIVRDSFHNLVVKQSSWIEHYQNHTNVCATRLSPLQAVNKLLEDIVWVSSYFHDTLMICREVLNTLDGIDHDEEAASQARRDISWWYRDTVAALEPALGKMSRRLYTCSLPDSSNQGAVIKLNLSKKVFFRRHIGNKPPYGTIGPDCDAIPETQAKSRIEICPWDENGAGNNICSISRSCTGTLYGCKDSNDLQAVCVSDSSNGQRYQYFYGADDEKIVSDNYGKCKERSLKKIYYWHYFNTGMYESCQCLCEEGEYWIDDTPVYSNLGMFIVGAKFVLTSENVLTISIQQGKLLPNGVIDVPEGGTLPWITGSGEKSNTTVLQVKSIIKYSTVNYMNISYHAYSFSSSGIYREINVTNADSPERATTSKMLQSNEIGFVTFTTTNAKDGGQSTIPFFDGQEVTSSIPTLLSGAGLYWKGKEGSGGYIGIELYTYNIVPNILKALDEE
ncbi:hypothetical protein QAD02_004611 [Eretmocerus hayati]|uniref:Uncharacterized protein n=1 Tax=Eretmocerus hayati TaxID=131215 RepID=A0ACC2NQI2_9HYME|nr:hypothetical protein QAD02_004611 [Eretmocerus hayati]